MVRTSLPTYNMDNSETQCCPRFDPDPWDGEEIEFQDWPFVRATTYSLMHIPLNMGSVIRRTCTKIEAAGAGLEDSYLMLSTDPSPWRGEHYFHVTKDVPGQDMVRLSAKFLTKVFEGPYRNAGKWAAEMEQYAKEQDRPMQKLYFFYTTCPKCAKHYGKNYVVGFAEV